MSRENVIRIAVRKFGPFESALQKLWDGYCAETGCTMQAEMVPMDLELLYESIITGNGLKNGDWDIAHIVTDWLYEAWSNGSLENLQDHIRQNPPQDYPVGWCTSLLAAQSFGNGIAGLPFHDGPECLIYRKDLFESPEEQAAYQQLHGKPLEVPKTWEEFLAVARFFTRPEQNLFGTVFAGYPDGHNTVFDFVLQLWTRGGQLIGADRNININTKEAAEGLEFYRSVIADSSTTHPGSKIYESVQMGMSFARGEVAMMVNWFGFASMCEVLAESAVKGKVDITTIPATGVSSASLNVYWLYTIGSGSRHKDIAYDFLCYAVNEANDKLLTMEGGIGCRISTWKDKEVNEVIPYYYKLQQLHDVAKSLPQRQDWPQIAKIIDEVVLSAINTDISAEQLLLEGQHKIDQLTQATLHANSL